MEGGHYVSLLAGQDSSLYKFATRGRKYSSLAGNLTIFSLNCSLSFPCTGLSHKLVPDFVLVFFFLWRCGPWPPHS